MGPTCDGHAKKSYFPESAYTAWVFQRKKREREKRGCQKLLVVFLTIRIRMSVGKVANFNVDKDVDVLLI